MGDARERLEARFGLSEAQSQAIVDMTLGRLSGLERQKIEERLQALYALIEELKGILADESKLTAIIKDDLQKIKDKYGDERRTSIEEVENEILIEDLIDRVSCVVTVTGEGYIKRLPLDTYQAQRRGGKGVTAMTTKEEDYVKDVIVAHSHDYLLMFSNRGRLYIKKCYEIPEAGRTSKGTNLVNVLSLEPDEEITAILSVAEFTADEYLVMLTRQGVVKRVNLMAYRTRRTGGLYAVTLDEGDELLPAAIDVVMETGQASVSMLQRRLKLGYSRAARIVDEMEQRGIVGPFEGSKPRQLLITREKWEEIKLRGGLGAMSSAAMAAQDAAAENPPVEEEIP